MLRLAVLFLVIAIIAALFGFWPIAGVTYSIAQVFFFIFIVLAILALLGGVFRAPPPV